MLYAKPEIHAAVYRPYIYYSTIATTKYKLGSLSVVIIGSLLKLPWSHLQRSFILSAWAAIFAVPKCSCTVPLSTSSEVHYFELHTVLNESKFRVLFKLLGTTIYAVRCTHCAKLHYTPHQSLYMWLVRSPTMHGHYNLSSWAVGEHILITMHAVRMKGNFILECAQ